MIEIERVQSYEVEGLKEAEKEKLYALQLILDCNNCGCSPKVVHGSIADVMYDIA